MSNVMRMSTRMHPFVQPFPAKNMLPIQDKQTAESQIKALVSKLKRLITTARIEAGSAQKEENHYLMINLRIAATYAAKKLRDLVDGKTSIIDEGLFLKDAIRVLEDVLKKSAYDQRKSPILV